MLRRIVDICFAVAALTLLAPLLVFIAIAIRIDSPGNPIYGGWRVGKGGKRFRMWKFRSMVTNADQVGPGITARRDSRVTRLGKTLRNTKLDELPQFVNLLTGDLTLIGPRAEVPDIVEKYSAEQRRVLDFMPGVTGVGAIAYTETHFQQIPDDVPADLYYIANLLDDKLRMEIEYEKCRSLSTDLGVTYRSVRLILRSILGLSGQPAGRDRPQPRR